MGIRTPDKGYTDNTETLEPIAPAIVSAAVVERVEKPGVLVARVVAVFAIIATGLGIATLGFLWVSGFFRTTGVDGPAAVVLSGVAALLVLVVSLILGVALAGVSGMYISRVAASRGEAMAIGLFAGGLGYAAMVLILGGILWAGFTAGVESNGAASPAKKSPAEIKRCEAVFGKGAEICRDISLPGVSRDATFPIEGLLQVCVGAIPAGLVAGLTAAATFHRRTGVLG